MCGNCRTVPCLRAELQQGKVPISLAYRMHAHKSYIDCGCNSTSISQSCGGGQSGSLTVWRRRTEVQVIIQSPQAVKLPLWPPLQLQMWCGRVAERCSSYARIITAIANCLGYLDKHYALGAIHHNAFQDNQDSWRWPRVPRHTTCMH